jgi:hypothetical protein
VATHLLDHVEGVAGLALLEDNVAVVEGLLLQAVGHGEDLVLVELLEDLHALQEVLVQLTLPDRRLHDDRLLRGERRCEFNKLIRRAGDTRSAGERTSASKARHAP